MKQNPKPSNLSKQKKKCLLKRGNYFLLGVKTNKKAPNIPKVLELPWTADPIPLGWQTVSPSPPSKQNVELDWCLGTALPRITPEMFPYPPEGARAALVHVFVRDGHWQIDRICWSGPWGTMVWWHHLRKWGSCSWEKALFAKLHGGWWKTWDWNLILKSN